MSFHPTGGGAARQRPSRSGFMGGRRSRLVLAASTALACLVLPLAATQAVGMSASVAGGHPTTSPALTSKFSAAALAVGAGKTPAARARIMARVTPDLPVEVDAYDVKPLWKKGIDGKGVNIATIVSFGDPDIQSVIDNYDKAVGLPKAHVTILAPVGDPSCPPGQESVCSG